MVESHSSISPDDFWNQPPAKALKAGITTSRGKKLAVQWPTTELPAATYYVALYFQDPRTASPFSWRVFDVAVNGNDFFRGLNASAAGVMVYSSMMQLSGKTEILLTPNETSPVGPLINAGEIYQIVPLGGRTATRDGMYACIFFSYTTRAYSVNISFNYQLAVVGRVRFLVQWLQWKTWQAASRTCLRTGLETLVYHSNIPGLGLNAPWDHPCASCHCKYSDYNDRCIQSIVNDAHSAFCLFSG